MTAEETQGEEDRNQDVVPLLERMKNERLGIIFEKLVYGRSQRKPGNLGPSQDSRDLGLEMAMFQPIQRGTDL